MKDKNDLKKEASKYTKDYTNEHIRKQIEENSTMFGFVIGLLAMGFSLILLSFIRAFIDIYPNVSVYRLLSEVLENHVVGIAFGVPLIVFACVGINEDGTLNMIKHIHPACSSKRYHAKEIDEMANNPETIWVKEAKVFVTPKTLIGINKGITVVNYEDIAGISLKVKHHSVKTTRGSNRGRMNVRRALYYALTDRYKEWDTSYFIIKTKKHRKLLLTEVADETIANRLIQMISERCPNIQLPKNLNSN